jgi:hypothetical protein
LCFALSSQDLVRKAVFLLPLKKLGKQGGFCDSDFARLLADNARTPALQPQETKHLSWAGTLPGSTVEASKTRGGKGRGSSPPAESLLLFEPHPYLRGGRSQALQGVIFPRGRC